MLPDTYLLNERVVRDDGSGPEIDLGFKAGKLLVLTLGITRAVERESLEVFVWGSEDGKDWDNKPLARYPQKFYCGLYSTLLNLAAYPKIRFLRVSWKVDRLTARDTPPMFGVYVFMQESGDRLTVGATVGAEAALSFA
jgi:hypothetical protein